MLHTGRCSPFEAGPALPQLGGGGWRAALPVFEFCREKRAWRPLGHAPHRTRRRVTLVTASQPSLIGSDLRGRAGGRDSAAVAGARSCQSGRSGAAGRTAGLEAPRRGCVPQPGKAKSRAHHLRGEACGTRISSDARRRRAPGGARLRSREPPARHPGPRARESPVRASPSAPRELALSVHRPPGRPHVLPVVPG